MIQAWRYREGAPSSEDVDLEHEPPAPEPGVLLWRPRELFDLSKALLRIRRAALPLREVVGQVLRREDPDIGDAALVHFQDPYVFFKRRKWL